MSLNVFKNLVDKTTNQLYNKLHTSGYKSYSSSREKSTLCIFTVDAQEEFSWALFILHVMLMLDADFRALYEVMWGRTNTADRRTAE